MRPISSSAAALLTAAGTLLSSSVFAQKTLYTLTGTGNDNVGGSVASAGDVNADGFEDWIVGAHADDTGGLDAGAAFVMSGRDGTTLYSLFGDSAGDHFGFSVAGVGDTNGDGYDDLLIGAPRDDNNGIDSGSTRLVSGIDGSTIRMDSGVQAGDRYGYSVSWVGDRNADGKPDLLVGAPELGTGRNGYAWIVSGFGGAQVVHGGGLGDDRLGFAVAGVGDVDADGFDDYALGAPGRNGGRGRATIISGRTSLPLFVYDGDSPNDELGHALTGAGDLNGDTAPDFAIGAPFDDNNGAQSGQVRVCSGADGTILFTLDGDAIDDRLGRALSRAGDLDGDGRDDLLVGAPQPSFGPGYARVYSGATGAALLTLINPDALEYGDAVAAADVDCDGTLDLIVGGPSSDSMQGLAEVVLYPPVDTHAETSSLIGPPNTEFGQGVAIIGDVNDDGHDDYVIGAPVDDVGGTDAGAVTLYSGADDAVLYTTTGFAPGDLLGIQVAACGDVSGDGVPDFLAGATQPGTGNGYAVLYSGLGGAIVIHGGQANGDQFGASVAGVGDFNGDGFPDFAVGGTQPGNGGAGYVTVYSEHPRGAIVIHGGANAQDQFGASVAAGDVNGDDLPDLFVGASQVGTGAGYVRVLDAATNALIRTHAGGGIGHRFGFAVASGDVDGDGAADTVVGAPWDSGGAPSGGAISVFSGATGAQLTGLFWTEANSFWGYTLACADLDHDGFSDVVSGTPFWNGNRGFANAYSVQLGAQMHFWGGPTPGRRGHEVAVGDLNRDGIADVLVGKPAGFGAAIRFESTSKRTGSAKFYGAPCDGSANNRPRIDVIGKPKIGNSFIVDLSGGRPNTTTFLAWGLAPDANVSWSGIPLPFDLGLIGAPGCLVNCAVDFSTVHGADADGRSGATIVLPSQSVTIGQRVFFQWLNLDAGANGLGLTTSNAMAITAGQ